MEKELTPLDIEILKRAAAKRARKAGKRQAAEIVRLQKAQGS